MFGIIGIKERDRHAPIVLGNVPDLRHLDGVVVVVMRIARRVVGVAAAEDEALMALVDVQVGVPGDGGDFAYLPPVLIAFAGFRFVFLGHGELHGLVEGETWPEFAIPDQREDFLVGDGIDVAHDDESLVMLHQRRHILAE